MRRLRVVTRPALLTGFRLAGVDAYSADDSEGAQALIQGWLDENDTLLLAIDDALLEGMDPRFVRSLDGAKHLSYLPIPGGPGGGFQASRERRIQEMIRQAVGFQITFSGLEPGEES